MMAIKHKYDFCHIFGVGIKPNKMNVRPN